MRIEFINPFVESSVEIIEEVSGAKVERQEIVLRNKITKISGIAAIIGVIGEADGRLLFDMTEETALNVASAMNDEKLTEMNTLTRETLTELANMITGKAITKLHAMGFKFKMTPPSLVTGRDMSITDLGVEVLVVPLKTSLGEIEVNIALKEN